MMEITPMQRRDIPAVCAIEQAVFADAWSEQTVTDSFESPFGVWMVVRGEDGVPVAYLGGMCIAGEAEIYRVAAHPEHRRQGLGEQLVRALAAMNGVDAIFLEVRRSNAPARALYEKCGFTVCGERKNYYEHPTEDAVLMRWEQGEGQL